MAWRERMRDAADPLNIPLSWHGAVGGYLPGGDAARPWTAQEWARFGNRPRLLIFVRSNPAGAAQAEDDVLIVLRQLWQLRVPRGRYVALDTEAAYDHPYCVAWAQMMAWAGFRPVHYRSEAVRPTGAFRFRWIAWYRGIGPFMAKGARATQYQSGPKYDSSTIRWWTYAFGHWWR